MTVDDLPWQPIHQAPHDKWLLLRGSSSHRNAPKRYVTARFESGLGCEWAKRFRDTNGDPVTHTGVMPSEFVELG
jgi:hypothetical protein